METIMDQERSLLHKSVVITGGVSGIGLAIARNFIRNKISKLALLDVNQCTGEEVTRRLVEEFPKVQIVFIKCNVAIKNEVEKTFDQIVKIFSRIDVVVNSAGIIDEKDYVTMIDINLTGLIHCSYKAWNLMRKDLGGSGGTVINIASVYGTRIEPFTPVYHATKYGVVGFTKSLGKGFQYERSGVRMLALCPGFTDTNFCDTSSATEKKVQDKVTFDKFVKYFQPETMLCSAAMVADGCLDMFQEGASGTAWVIEGDEPAFEF